MFTHFVCNICGARNDAENVHRELAPCASCGSNARFRAMMAGLSIGLHGRIIPLWELQPEPALRGFGCSDEPPYAGPLARLYAYTNTYLHTEPRVDIGDAATLAPFNGCGFILCSDVLEHVLGDPADAIRAMFDCLAPGGCLILSAPSYDMPATMEKYPSLRRYSSVNVGGRYAVVYETVTGQLGFDPNPVFHGGPGSVLEMRLFSHAALSRLVAAAGFRHHATIGAEAAEYGAIWPPVVEREDAPYPLDGRVIVAIK